MYSLMYKKSAIKALRKVSGPIAKRIMTELELIALDPANYQGDWKPMKGSSYWRLRQGGYRAICSFDNGELTLLVLKVGARGDIYK